MHTSSSPKGGVHNFSLDSECQCSTCTDHQGSLRTDHRAASSSSSSYTATANQPLASQTASSTGFSTRNHTSQSYAHATSVRCLRQNPPELNDHFGLHKTIYVVTQCKQHHHRLHGAHYDVPQPAPRDCPRTGEAEHIAEKLAIDCPLGPFIPPTCAHSTKPNFIENAPPLAFVEFDQSDCLSDLLHSSKPNVDGQQ